MPDPRSRFPRIAFVDLETTGATAHADRITEVGIVEVDEDGVREWSTLVNPETRIPEFIQSLTGITNEMVAGAPTFAEIADALHARLAGRLFVAHNARFDHGFLKNEFRRTGHAFRPTVLCTVKLSRRLYPGHARHNLDSVIERLRLDPGGDRHRALTDARVLYRMWETVHRTLPPEDVDRALAALTARPSLPSHLDEDLLDDLPTTHGVYLFHGENGLPLYIGKANDLRKRVMSHFSADHQSARELKLSQQVRRIEWIETAGELGALLLESQLVKRMMPAQNMQLRRNEEICAWRLVERGGHMRLSLARADDLFFGNGETLYGLFTSARKATDAMKAVADEHQLCPGLLGLERHRDGAPCFASQVKRCLGACCGREPAAEHDARVRTALDRMALKPWPYPGAVGLEEGDVLHVVDRWAYVGTAGTRREADDLLRTRRPPFDRDVYLLMQKWLPKLDAQGRIRPLE
ncbi:MAG: exonuclease domain-containing protein [Burkholderiaceae bacterium]